MKRYTENSTFIVISKTNIGGKLISKEVLGRQQKDLKGMTAARYHLEEAPNKYQHLLGSQGGDKAALR